MAGDLKHKVTVKVGDTTWTFTASSEAQTRRTFNSIEQAMIKRDACIKVEDVILKTKLIESVKIKIKPSK